MKLIFSILIFINSIALAYSQQSSDAQSFINNYLSQVKASAIQTDFNLKVVTKNSVNSQSVSGNLIMKANQFYLKMDDIRVWFDGTTQWAYFKQNNEVTITQPTTDELAETNPMTVLSSFSKRSKASFRKSGNTGITEILLIPVSKNDSFRRVTVQFIKNGTQLQSIEVVNKDGSEYVIKLHNYNSRVTVASNQFVFNKSGFPGVIINDLR
jgi:outer membrane lipoprotein-sorting protein